ncbi:MAG: DUF3352 domain-containing protein [Cyanophyceae cyanobacterium]
MAKQKIRIGCLCLTLISSTIIVTDFHSRILLANELTPLEGARLIPKEALGSLYISTSSQDWQKIQQSAPPEAQSLFKHELNAFSQTAALQKIDYQQDIRPWLGNIVLVFLPKDNFPERSRENYVAIIGVKNKLGLLKLASHLRNQNDLQIESSNYQNVPIVKVTDSNRNIMWLAVFKGQLLMSSSSKGLELAIDVYQAEAYLGK